MYFSEGNVFLCMKNLLPLV